MDGEETDGELLYSEEVYNMLREDSAVRRVGSYNFARLVNTPSPPDLQMQDNSPPMQNIYQGTSYGQPETGISHQHLSGHHQQFLQPSQHHTHHTSTSLQPSQHHNHHTGTSLHPSHYESTLSVVHQESSTSLHPQQYFYHPPSQELPHQVLEDPWESVDDGESAVNESPPLQLPPLTETPSSESPLAFLSSKSNRIPVLQPWKGIYDFEVNIISEFKERNKWGYSSLLNKLYTLPNTAIPVDISLSRWIDATVCITPVYIHSQYLMEPVTRCPNCKNPQRGDENIEDHIVHVKGQRVHYSLLNNRPVVAIPLNKPPPGENKSTILVKIMCRTTCVGGPNRRPFSLLVTLYCNASKEEVGRQVIQLKCCQSPKRDMKNDEGPIPKDSDAFTSPAPVLDEQKRQEVGMLASQIIVTKKRKSSPSRNTEVILVTKVEPKREDDDIVNIPVPSRFERQMKKYANYLMLSEHLGKNKLGGLALFPEVEKDEDSDST